MKSSKSQQGFSLIELLIVVAIIGIIAAIAIPNLLASRRAANEASAIANLRTMASAQATYQTTHGGGTTYAGTLTNMSAVGLIDSSLASGQKSGYNYVVSAVAPAAGAPANFTMTAVPVSTAALTATGVRGFFIDATGVIRFDSAGAVPDTADPPLAN